MAEEIERRNYRRVKDGCNIKIDILEEAKITKGFKTSQTRNISASGVLMKYSKPIAIESLIDVTFLGPNSFEIFKIKARVVRIEINPDRSYDLGVTFTNLSAADKKRLDYYLTYN